MEASPDGTKPYVAGSFNTVNGVTRQKMASLNLTTGAPVESFAVTRSTNNQATALAVTDDTVYVGGRFTGVNGVLRANLAALDGVIGAVDTLQPDGTMAAGLATIDATLASPGATSTGFTLPVDLPTRGEFSVEAWAVDTSGQLDTSTSGATARYLVYPGDADPTLHEEPGRPTDGTAFTESRIVVSGRAPDDVGMSRVDAAIGNSAGQG